MRLIFLHKMHKYSDFIEGFHENYRCITLWNDSDGLQVSSSTYFKYTSENRVPKFTNPFRRQ